jgi:hypothetical protein
VATRLVEQITRAYRLRLRTVRAETIRRLGDAYGRTVTEAEIEASFAAFVPIAARHITAGQGAAQTLTRAYLRGISRLDPLPVATLAGTSKAGTITDALTGIAPFILGAIANGASASQAVNVTGAYFVDRMADNEITRVVDREIEGQKARAKGWEGITSAPSDPCVGNAGFHSFDEDIYRHPGCNCERVVVYG